MHPACVGEGVPVWLVGVTQGNQVGHVGPKHRQQHAACARGGVFQRQLGGAHTLGSQGDRVHHATGGVNAVVTLVGVGGAVGGAMQHLDGGGGVPPVHQAQPRVHRALAARLPPPAQTGVQREIGAKRKLVLNKNAQGIAGAAGVQVVCPWLQIEIELIDARVTPVVHAPRKLVACQCRADPLPLGCPPLPGSHIAVHREGRVVVDIVAHVFVAARMDPAGQRQGRPHLGGVFGRQARGGVGQP